MRSVDAFRSDCRPAWDAKSHTAALDPWMPATRTCRGCCGPGYGAGNHQTGMRDPVARAGQDQPLSEQDGGCAGGCWIQAGESPLPVAPTVYVPDILEPTTVFNTTDTPLSNTTVNVLEISPT